MTDIPEDKFKLWFFRDLSSDQRKKLFGVFGMPMDQLDTHGSQALALRHLFSAETVTSADCSGLLPCAICGLDADTLGLSASRIRSCLLDKPEAAETVGEAGEMPGSNGGFTMAVFKASDVPLGTKLYTRPADTDAAQSTPEAIVRSAASAVIDELAERFAEKPGTADDYADYMRRIPEAIISALKGDRGRASIGEAA